MTIDAVFTWVDGNDPDLRQSRMDLADFTPPPPLSKWQKKSEYTGLAEARENPVVSIAQSESRFRNMDELRYALRALETHAPWIGTVHLVTNGQVPDWIDQAHPRLRLVTHAEIFPDPTCLPTFNSNAIELQLHRIPGLSEEFIYFNDDFFLGAPVSPDDFRFPDGRHRLFVEEGRGLPLHMTDRSLTGHMWAYNHNLIEERFGKKRGRLQFAHTPQLYSRTLLTEMQALWREECVLTARHKFRTPFDAALRILYTCYVAEGGLGGAGIGNPANLGEMDPLSEPDYVFVKLGDDRTPYMDDIAKVLHDRPRFFCVNDEIRSGDPERDDALKDMFQAMLDHLYPTPSSFEIPTSIPARPVLPQPSVECPAVQRVFVSTPGLEWRSRTDANWQVLDPTGQMAALPPEAELRRRPAPMAEDNMSPVATIPTALSLRMECAGDDLYPERGFWHDRRCHRILPADPDATYPLSRAVHSYRADQQVLDQLAILADPALVHPSNTPMGRFLCADRILRGGGGAEQAALLETYLQEALLGGVNPGWVCHRLVLLALQSDRHDHLREYSEAAMSTGADARAVLVDLAERLFAKGARAGALAIAEGLSAHPEGRQAGLTLRLRIEGPGGISDPEREALIAAPDATAEEIALWTQLTLARATPPGPADLDRIGILIALPDSPPETQKAARLARFCLRAAAGQMTLAALDLRHVLQGQPSVVTLLALAQGEGRAGRPQTELCLLSGLRIAMPWEPDPHLAWAEAMVRQGHSTPEIQHILTEALQRDEDRSAQLRVLRAYLVGKDNAAAESLLTRLARDPAAVVPMLGLCRDLHGDGYRAAALTALDYLRRHWPANAEIQITWADRAITAGQSSDDVLQAIALAEQAGAHPYWAGYHRLRALGALDRLDAIAPVAAGLGKTDADLSPLLRLVREWRESRRTDAALALLEGVRQSHPDHGPAAQAWADLAIGKGQRGAEVARALDCALANGHDPYWTRYHRLRLYLAESQMGRALTECHDIHALGGSPAPFVQVISEAGNLDDLQRAALLEAVLNAPSPSGEHAAE